MCRSLLLGHGRAHHKLPEIDYEKSKFVDIDPKVAPDCVMNLKGETIQFDGQYDEAIMVGCSSLLLCYDKFSRYDNPSGLKPDLNEILIRAVHRCLDCNGKFYITNPYDRTEIYRDIIIDIERMGFFYAGTKFREGMCGVPMLVFQKV